MGSPDRTGPSVVGAKAGDGVDMKLWHEIANGGDVNLMG